jgi:vacuolar-type H+-ATPase subunit I/STV1
VLGELRFTHLPQRRRASREESTRLERFLNFIGDVEAQDPATASELEKFLRQHLDTDKHVRELEKLRNDLDLELSTLLSTLEEYNADFEALQKLESKDYGFSSEELKELRSLLGLYGSEIEKRLPPGKAMDTEYVGQRQRSQSQVML